MRFSGPVRSLFCLVLLLALDAGAATPDQTPVTGSIVGYAPQGMFSVVGEGVVEAVRREYPGSSLTYEPGSPAGGIAMLAAGSRSFAMQTPADLYAALKGDPPYKQSYPKENFMIVARLIEGFAFMLYARQSYLDKYQVSSLAEIVERHIPTRWNTGTKGNLLSQGAMEIILSHYGIGYRDIVDWGGEVTYLSQTEGEDLIRTDKGDIQLAAAFVPSARLIALHQSTGIRVLPLPEELVQKLNEGLGMQSYVVPKSAYDFLDADLLAPAAYFLLTAGKSASEADAYKIARALYRQFDFYRKLHPHFENLSRNMLVAPTPPLSLHPGARAFYREVGLLPE